MAWGKDQTFTGLTHGSPCLGGCRKLWGSRKGANTPHGWGHVANIKRFGGRFRRVFGVRTSRRHLILTQRGIRGVLEHHEGFLQACALWRVPGLQLTWLKIRGFKMTSSIDIGKSNSL